MKTFTSKRSLVLIFSFLATILFLLLMSQTAYAATRTWDGEGGDDNFSTASNWVGDTAPVADDDIVLDTTGLSDVMFNNDLTADTQFGSITLDGTGSGAFTLSGNSVILTGGIDNSSTYNFAKFYVELDITLNGDQTFTSNSKLVIGASDGSNTLDIDTYTLSKTGEYPLVLNSVTSGSGGITVSNGDFVADKANTFTGALTIDSGGVLKGTGTVGQVDVNSGGTVAPGLSPGCLTTGDLTFNSGSVFIVEIEGATVCSEYDQTDVTGTVTLGDATLTIQKLASFTPEVGAQFVVIQNDGADAVTGTFSGLVEGATTTVDAVEYTVSYVGGDGNDVVLTATAVTTPDTGFGSYGVNYLFVAFVTVIATAALVITGRKLNKINA